MGEVTFVVQEGKIENLQVDRAKGGMRIVLFLTKKKTGLPKMEAIRQWKERMKKKLVKQHAVGENPANT